MMRNSNTFLNIMWSRFFLLTLAVLITVSMSIAYVASVPREHERFISLSTLGSNMKVSDYYPTGRPDISLNDNVRWYIQVYNNMGSAEYIAVRVKVLMLSKSLQMIITIP